MLYKLPQELKAHDRVKFNARDTINPSLADMRRRRIPMSDEVRAIVFGTQMSTIEFFGGAIIVIENTTKLEVIPKEESYKPESPKRPTTFYGVSIE